ncbi:MAG: hypothetical protein ABH863_03545 [Candidatus Micrarchaeota archaeon]
MGQSGGKKAQSSIELMIILAVGLIVLGFVLSTSQQRIGSSQQVLAFATATSSVNALANAADEAYFGGVGSRREVQFILPEGVLSATLSTNSIHVRLASQNGISDVVANTKGVICPNSLIPTKIGTSIVVVESLPGCIAIGANSNLTVSSTLIRVNAQPDSYLQKSLTYKNTGNSLILVNLALVFASLDVAVFLADPADEIFIIAGGQEREVWLNFSIPPEAQGTHLGNLETNGSEGTNLSTIISVSILGGSCGAQTECPPAVSNVSLIEIKTYSSDSYSQLKEIFDPSEEISIQGGNWDPLSALDLDVRDPMDSFSLPGYPKSLTTNSSGGFNDSLLSSGLGGMGYIVRASGLLGGIPESRTAMYDVNSCT